MYLKIFWKFVTYLFGGCTWDEYLDYILLVSVEDQMNTRYLPMIRKRENFAQDEDQLRLYFAGTGNPMAYRPGSATCFLANGDFALVDAGPKSIVNTGILSPRSIPCQRLNHIFITHFHSDHVTGLPDIILDSWVIGRKKRVKIYGPPGIKEVVDGANKILRLDNTYRTAHHTQELMPLELAAAEAVVIHPGDCVKLPGGMTFEPFEVDHSPASPAYGYKITFKDRTVVMSGDSLVVPETEKQAKDCDILIHDTMQQKTMAYVSNMYKRLGRMRLSKMMSDTWDYHALCEDVIDLANRCGCKCLVMHHLTPEILPHLLWFQQKIQCYLLYTRFFKKLNCEGHLAFEQTEFVLPANSKEIIKLK